MNIDALMVLWRLVLVLEVLYFGLIFNTKCFGSPKNNVQLVLFAIEVTIGGFN